jgi:hypothetical protein
MHATIRKGEPACIIKSEVEPARYNKGRGAGMHQ